MSSGTVRSSATTRPNDLSLFQNLLCSPTEIASSSAHPRRVCDHGGLLAITALSGFAREARDASTLLYSVIASDQRERGNLSFSPRMLKPGFETRSWHI